MLGGVGPQGITRVGRTLSARWIETQIWFPSGSACWNGEASRKGQWLLPALLLGESHPCSPCPEASLSSSLCVPGAFRAIAPGLELRVSPSVVSSCTGPLRGHLVLQLPSVSLSYHPCWLSQPEVVGTGTLGWRARCGAGAPCFCRDLRS